MWRKHRWQLGCMHLVRTCAKDHWCLFLWCRPCLVHRFQEKLLPLLIHHNAPDLFSYRHCSFKVQKSKSGTGRVVGFRELGLVNRWVWGLRTAVVSSGCQQCFRGETRI